MNFLSQKTKEQKVLLKYDHQKLDSDNNLLCYVYLKNKTFLNAHLIKKGLASVDRDMEFRYKDKFIRLEEESQNG